MTAIVMSPSRQILLLCGLVAVVYANAISGSFHYDDFHSLVDNPSIRAPVDWGALLSDPRSFSVDSEKAMYRPLVLVSYALQHARHGYETAGYHVVNLLLHLGCVLLARQVVIALHPTAAGAHVAWVAAALFAVHPVTSEPVNYVSSRSETLSAALMLLALWGALRIDADPRRGLWALPAYGAALLSKATAAAMPLLLLAKLFVLDGRRWTRPAGWSLLVSLACVGAYVVLLSTQSLLPADRPEPVRSTGAQLMTQVKAVWFYLYTAAVPTHLSVDPAFTEGAVRQSAVWVSLLLLVSVAWQAIRASRFWRWWLLWPAIVALPASAVPLNVLVNEHRIYLALAGVCVLWAALLIRARQPVVLWGMVVVLGVLTVQRNDEWETETTLWASAVEAGPMQARARVHLGNALRVEGNAPAAARQFEQAVSLEPQNLAARTNLANTLYEQAAGDAANGAAHLASAMEQYQFVLNVKPQHREALTNLGNVQRLHGDLEGAQQLYQRAIDAHPHHADAYANLADLYLEQSAASHAVPVLRRLVELEPDVATGHRRLGDAEAMSGNLLPAAGAYQRACQLDPLDGAACYNGAEVLRVLGDQAAEAGDTANARRRWSAALSGYRHVLATQGAYRQAQTRVGRLQQQLAGGNR